MEHIGEFVTSTILIVLRMVIGGFTASVLWGWFVVTSFGAPVLSIPGAIGVAIVVKIFTLDTSKKEPELEKPIYLALGKGLLRTTAFCGVTLLYGWIIKAFM
jgi:hypothetical protein